MAWSLACVPWPFPVVRAEEAWGWCSDVRGAGERVRAGESAAAVAVGFGVGETGRGEERSLVVPARR